MNKAIRVENLSKLYHIGQGKTAAYETLSERITDMLTGPLRSMRSVLQGQSSAVAGDSIWALKDVSFEVEHGEVVGIIGRNGAGKSTLLKILSQITEPTEGHIDLYGRVGALLEVGTGFHPELTGRENVFLNGAILGMTRNDIQRKFDEIVDFSGVEKFIDTPVKHYSSGMQVRLAFAVAAHLEPEILVVDEVLAVGDAEFQKKCLGKMGDVSREGRTVLFVSHNMGAIKQFTRRCAYLREGSLATIGDTYAIVSQYLNETVEAHVEGKLPLQIYRGSIDTSLSPVLFANLWVNDGTDSMPQIPLGQGFVLSFEIDVTREISGTLLNVLISNSEGVIVAVYSSWDEEFRLSLKPGKYELTLDFAHLHLAPGRYFVSAGITPAPNVRGYEQVLDVPLLDVINENSVSHWVNRPWGIIYQRSVPKMIAPR